MRAAIYARYSTELQRQESITDQHRVCERIAEQHGFRIVARFADEAISGGTAQRPQYQAMLTAARARKFDVILAEDTSRLWRNLAEQAPRLAELADMGIAVVTHDLDTRQESAGILGAVGGAMAEQYRKEIGRRTRRGLEGLARNAKPTGGKSYGYTAARDGDTGQVEVNEAEAAIVRRIFADYADGMSPKAIAAALNREGVPSPGASWGKSSRRAQSWRYTAIYGQPARGLGILNNEAYVGRVIWNRFRWVRSATDSSKRRCLPNPRADWIVRQDDRLRVVSDDLWQRVKSRQQQQAERIGDRIRAGLPKDKAARVGAGHKFLFSGLLECAHCGGSISMVNADRYGCSAYSNGRACTNAATFKRSTIERGLLTGIQTELRRPEIVEEARRRIVAALRKSHSTAPKPAPERVRQLEAEVGRIVDAIAGGALRASPALAQRLLAAESELETLRAPVQPATSIDPAQLTPRVVDRYLSAIDRLPELLNGTAPDRAREELRRLIGPIEVEADAEEVRFRTKKGALEGALSRMAGGPSVFLVAGVGFEPTTFGL